ncbi:MAG: hypothetical protein IJM30_08410 [Thermoguttaceae bacterium]|nr:hypothetical protein [Thermoguttaceae bacterium]
MRNDNDLFFVCSLIEFLGRERRLSRKEVVARLGKETIQRVYDYADVFHCEPIAKVADDFVQLRSLPTGSYDNVADCRYNVPDYWTIGKVYARLIDDVAERDGSSPIDALEKVYASWIDEAISNYNSDFFYQPRDYLFACFDEGEVLDG